ncbi:MAG: hypothetical protein COV02_01110 [Candidatus Terrybacteria bacterium CG10_big_fil_rev_8_21_14_0_10_41_10]|uniref:Polymerase beta nucleotidyltransferase domain-containing protein n=1 Tax=Candidatus Terrybacteria bacterium CG10_big_fil_rev_8_21_14_0_10_41_10 TaxID=1975026 RepID=A0A2M8LAT6_9BACT|nr:MAG: hypothetical protein COV02_01110 [Candidatus Terrybacteria bacterium CG10_big_fil_rev_8_21_14_0_10_41_10]
MMESIMKNKDLMAIFKENNVSFAYLFGSLASGNFNQDSDIDIAVMLPFEMKKKERFDLRLKLMGEISKILKKKVDVVVLNDVSSLYFKYIIIKEGKIIYKEIDLSPAEFESKTLGIYFDFRSFLENYNKAYVKRSLQ